MKLINRETHKIVYKPNYDANATTIGAIHVTDNSNNTRITLITDITSLTTCNHDLEMNDIASSVVTIPFSVTDNWKLASDVLFLILKDHGTQHVIDKAFAYEHFNVNIKQPFSNHPGDDNFGIVPVDRWYTAISYRRLVDPRHKW
jgi:hypothetical protein